jgi:adenylosuccinate synthase
MVDILLGLQWGDEGKGKIVDVMTPIYDIIARFQGGPNAGHTLEFDGFKHVLHTIPSGIFHQKTINIVGNGVVIDPVIFSKEIEKLKERGVNTKSNLYISRKAHLILPSHRLLDQASEASKGKSKIGSTLKGIGPTYMDKTGRNGLRVGDIEAEDFMERYHFLKKKHLDLLKHLEFIPGTDNYEQEWFESIEILKNQNLIDSEHVINKHIKEGRSILAEGAQGSLLDIDFGSYPYVTSSNTVAAGTCTGLGVAPKHIDKVFGIFKAYCTRVGSGPFPTELHDDTGELMRKKGNEFGATTGRPRRCGWLDLPALKYAVMINGVTHLIMTKPDILSGFDAIKVCVAYEYRGEMIDYLPYDIVHQTATPVYIELKGWKQDLMDLKSSADIPDELESYIQFLENELNVPVSIVSYGPDRSQTFVRKEFSKDQVAAN